MYDSLVQPQKYKEIDFDFFLPDQVFYPPCQYRVL